MFTVVYVTCPSTHNILTHMLAMLSLSRTYMAKQLLNYSVSQKHPNPQFLVLTAVTTQVSTSLLFCSSASALFQTVLAPSFQTFSYPLSAPILPLSIYFYPLLHKMTINRGKGRYMICVHILYYLCHISNTTVG